MFAVRYKEIADTLRQRIENGVYNRRLPALRSLCSEFGVCKSTISKVFSKLAQAGLVKVTRHGTLIIISDTPHDHKGSVAIVTRKLDIEAQQGDADFIGTLKSELKSCGFTSTEVELYDNNWNYREFWQKLNFDGYIFIYSSFYLLPGEHIDFSSAPRVIANYLPEEIDEYCVDFDDAAGLKDIVRQITEMGFKKIALAINVRGNGVSEAYFNAWRKLMRNFKLYNYNSAMEDFAYSPQVAERWINMAEPPEFVICANTRPDAIIQDMNMYSGQVRFYQLGAGSQAYIRLGKALAQTFAAVYSCKPNVSKRRFIGRYLQITDRDLILLHNNEKQ